MSQGTGQVVVPVVLCDGDESSSLPYVVVKQLDSRFDLEVLSGHKLSGVGVDSGVHCA